MTGRAPTLPVVPASGQAAPPVARLPLGAERDAREATREATILATMAAHPCMAADPRRARAAQQAAAYATRRAAQVARVSTTQTTAGGRQRSS